MTEIPPDLPGRTRRVYEAHAEAFDRHRPKVLIERPWLERLEQRMPDGLGLLDVGCGAGEPIARWFVERGRSVTGVDFATAMVALCRLRFPEQRWQVADMRELDLGATFGGVIAWDSLFHLTAEEQRDTLPRLARHVAPGGALLFTCGPEEGEVTGTVEGETVYHASLSPDEYRRILETHGLEVEAFVPEDPDCDLHTICLARRT